MIPSKFSLKNKCAIVVGAGRGWHAEIAAYLAEAGARVAVVGQDAGRMKEASDKLKGLGDQVICITVELNEYGIIKDTIEDIVARYGDIDILVNNIDTPLKKPFLDMTTNDWHQAVSGNLTSLFQWTQEVGRRMVERKQGRIINISSILSERGLPNSAAYCTAMGGTDQLTKALALEWARQNITVNAIGVGWTPYNDKEEAEAEERLRKYIPLGRFCQADDIAAILLYLASSSSGYVTGQTFFVSGGVMSHG